MGNFKRRANPDGSIEIHFKPTKTSWFEQTPLSLSHAAHLLELLAENRKNKGAGLAGAAAWLLLSPAGVCWWRRLVVAVVGCSLVERKGGREGSAGCWSLHCLTGYCWPQLLLVVAAAGPGCLQLSLLLLVSTSCCCRPSLLAGAAVAAGFSPSCCCCGRSA